MTNGHTHFAVPQDIMVKELKLPLGIRLFRCVAVGAYANKKKMDGIHSVFFTISPEIRRVEIVPGRCFGGFEKIERLTFANGKVAFVQH